MLFRGKFLHNGEIVVRHADIEMVRSIQDGVQDWKGSFVGPLRKLLAGKTYQLILDNGRSADVQLIPSPTDSADPEKVHFSIPGGFR
jgi:hypothetical protein